MNWLKRLWARISGFFGKKKRVSPLDLVGGLGGWRPPPLIHKPPPEDGAMRKLRRHGRSARVYQKQMGVDHTLTMREAEKEDPPPRRRKRSRRWQH